MSDFDIDIGGMLGDMRPQELDKKDTKQVPMVPVVEEKQVITEPMADVIVADGFDVEQTQQETVGGSNVKKPPDDVLDWKAFKTLPGIFEHVGGLRPVRLNPSITRSQVSGIPTPLLTIIQQKLKDRHLGATVDFPWGTYTITDQNKVFTAKTSIVRYLLFDAFKDQDGTHVQFAKQWLVLQHPAFTAQFDPSTHLSSTNDELDIYALMFVAHSVTNYTASSEVPHAETTEQLGMLNLSVTRILDKLKSQEQVFDAFVNRSVMTQTIILLDRMGLLKGAIPKDMDSFIGLLEHNRDILSSTGTVIDRHIHAEKERQKTILRDQRLRNR